MTTKELIKLLSEYPDDTEVQFVASYKDSCDCRADQYCYYSYNDHYYYIHGVSERTEYDKKTKKQKIIGVCIIGDE